MSYKMHYLRYFHMPILPAFSASHFATCLHLSSSFICFFCFNQCHICPCDACSGLYGGYLLLCSIRHKEGREVYSPSFRLSAWAPRTESCIIQSFFDYGGPDRTVFPDVLGLTIVTFQLYIKVVMGFSMSTSYRLAHVVVHSQCW